MNFEFQMPVTGSTTPKSGLDDRSAWLWPQAGQYCAISESSELQYQQVAMAGILGIRALKGARRTPGRVESEFEYGRSRGALWPGGGARAGRPAGHQAAPEDLRRPRRTAQGGRGLEAA